MAVPAHIPVIDLVGAAGSATDREAVARELVDAAVQHGFVYIRNTGREIPVASVEEAFAISRKLFALPAAEKEPSRLSTNNRGWVAERVETLDPKNQKAGDAKEAFNFGEFLNGRAQQSVPAALADDEPRLAAFFGRCFDLCLTLNDLLGIGLEVNPPDFFTAAHRREAGASDSTLRLLYYPLRQADDPEAVRAGAHSDYGSMTLLFRLAGQAGLEISRQPDVWEPVPVTPAGTETDAAPPILVNIGDLLAYWTGGLLRSTVHRVVMPVASESKTESESASAGPRYSIAFFCHPARASSLTPVPSDRVARAVAAAQSRNTASDNCIADEILTADDHLRMRLRATYLGLY